MSAVILICPYCEQPHEDTWEVLDVGVIEEMRCDVCARPFAFVILECAHCASERVMTWRVKPGETSIAMLTCEQCHRAFGSETISVYE